MNPSGGVLVSLSVVIGAVCLFGGAAVSQAPTVKVDGSSIVYPVADAVAEAFQKAKKGATRVTVGMAGTVGGFKKFARGETDVCTASRPISKDAMKACKEGGIEYIELPICIDALTVLVNSKNDWATSITVDELKKIWEAGAQGKITHWNQIRPEWPNERLGLIGPGADTGTFDYFTEAVCGRAKASRGDYTAFEDDTELVDGVDGNKHALGYCAFGYYTIHQDKLKALGIESAKNSVKTPVLPSVENVMKGAYNPLSRPMFLYVNKKSADKPEVTEFVEFFLKEGPALIREVKYLPLPAAVYATCAERFAKRQVGTALGGVPEVGLTIEELMKRTPSIEVKDDTKSESSSTPKK